MCVLSDDESPPKINFSGSDVLLYTSYVFSVKPGSFYTSRDPSKHVVNKEGAHKMRGQTTRRKEK
jgi:hypothetical protein